MKLRFKILLGNAIFTLIFYLGFHLLEYKYSLESGGDFYETLDKVIEVILYSYSYLLILPIWVITYFYGRWKSNYEVAIGAALSLLLSLLAITLFSLTAEV